MKKIILLIFLLSFLFQFVSADVISINSGGSGDLCITSGGNIEDCFFCIPTTCSKLLYNCDEWDDGCGKTLSCGTCPVGQTCTNGLCTVVPIPPEGGGGGGGGTTPVSGIVIIPTSINLTLSFNNQTHMSQRVTQKIYITNNGDVSQNLSINQFGLDNILILGSTSIKVGSKETKELSIDFVAPFEEKDVTGYIQIDGKKVSVFLHITSNPLWFDSNIVVLNRDYKVSRGNLLKTKVELVPMGEESRLDVILNYFIKDTSGKIYLTKTETVLVEKRMNFNRDFETGMLPLGKYIVALDLVYPGGTAPSSAHFEVVKKSAADIFGIVLFFLVIGILLIAIFIIFLLIKRRKRRREEET